MANLSSAVVGNSSAAAVFRSAPPASLSPLYANGIPLSSLLDALNSTGSKTNPTVGRLAPDQFFWSTPERLPTDTRAETYELTLATPQRVNRLAFDVPRFPATTYVYYRSDNRLGTPWKPVIDGYGRKVRFTVSDSIPSVISTAPYGGVLSSTHALRSPQHYGAGHWMQVDLYLSAGLGLMQQLKFVQVRNPQGKSPTGAGGRKIPYSLGLRGIKVGYQVSTRKDIPLTERTPLSMTERSPFSTTTDILGSPVTLSVRENRASDLLRGATWKCEPQPVADAVVNLYVDSRDGSGNGQVIDRFYLDPVTPGVSMNLYYSNDSLAESQFPASTNPLPYPVTRPAGLAQPTPTGILFPAAQGYVDVDNQALQFHQGNPFWVGMSLTPLFDSTDTDSFVFLDTGFLTIQWTNGALRVSFGDVILVDDQLSFPAGLTFQIGVSYDGTAVTLYNSLTQFPRSATITVPQSFPTASDATNGAIPGIAIRLGGALSQTPGYGMHTLNGLILKTETLSGLDELDTFFADVEGYISGSNSTVALDGSVTGATSDNALLRILPSYQQSTSVLDAEADPTYAVTVYGYSPYVANPFGLLGGRANPYADLTWTPINRSLRLAKGYVHLDPTKAKFWKFEFSNLQAQPYDNYEVVSRTVNLMPSSAIYQESGTGAPTSGSGGTAAVVGSNSVYNFSDSGSLYSYHMPTQPPSNYQPTTGVYASDPNTAAQIRNQTVVYNGLIAQGVAAGGVFPQTGQHTYETTEVAHANRVAFFVALRQLTMYRVDYTNGDDTGMYLEPFMDDYNLAQDEATLASQGWSFDADHGGVLAPSSLTGANTASITSKPFGSSRRVVALQYATQQSPPTQLLADPDMNDFSLSSWAGIGDASLESSAQYLTSIGTTVKVSRNPNSITWGQVQGTYQAWSDLQASHQRWVDITGTATASALGGIGSINATPPSATGRLAAAARVYSTVDLSAPLTLQIVDQNGVVLANESRDVKAGQITEWFTTYELTPALTEPATWSTVESYGTWSQVQGVGSWADVIQVQSGYSGLLSAQLVQQAITSDTFWVDNISLYEDSILWEFSHDGGKTFVPGFDVCNNPDGVVSLPPLTGPQDGKSLVWRLTMSRNDQRVNYLAIRPWYDSLPFGQPYRETVQQAGPNVVPSDQYASVHDDPRWKNWSAPIPQDWWFSFRQWMHQQPKPAQLQTPEVLASRVTVGAEAASS